jgi:hypothetical protein
VERVKLEEFIAEAYWRTGVPAYRAGPPGSTWDLPPAIDADDVS